MQFATHRRGGKVLRLLLVLSPVWTMADTNAPATIPDGLAPYLDTMNVLPQSAMVPGAIFTSDPVTDANESAKAWLAGRNITYTVFHGLNLIGIPRRIEGSALAGTWSGQAFANIGLLESPALGGTMGWISAEFDWTLGVGAPANSPPISSRIGSTLQPDGTTLGEGIWIAELGWEQSFAEGAVVVGIGMLDQGNYLDLNRYANNQFTQLSNLAFVNNQALPTPGQAPGLNIQWQPSPRFYAEVSTFAANITPGSAPLSGLSLRDWATQFEAGWITPNLLGAGENVVRIQPFFATSEGIAGVGIGLNIEQQIGGPQSRWGWFGRAGLCEPAVAVSGFETQASMGITYEAPNAATPIHDTRPSRWSAGVVWGRPADSSGRGEFGLELLYCLQLTATLSLRPDVQWIWVRTGVPAPETAVVLQFQAIFVW